MFYQPLILAADAQAVDPGMLAPMYLIMFGGVILLFFFMSRKQKKKENEEKQMRENVQIGDEITTIGGIVGIVIRKSEDAVVIETGSDRSKLRIKAWAIRDNLTAIEAAEAAKKNKLEEAKQRAMNPKAKAVKEDKK